MSGVPLIIVVGGDALAIRVCEEITGTQGHRVALLWTHDSEIAAKCERMNVTYIAFPPNDYDALRAAGVMHGTSIMSLSDDDKLNLQVALKARDLNPEIRVVLRQFNRTLGRKIEQNLPNCSTVSLASHAAATFTGSAIDPQCFSGLQFPEIEGDLCGFSQRRASEFGIAVPCSIADVQKTLSGRVVGLNGRAVYDLKAKVDPDDDVVLFSKFVHLAESRQKPSEMGERRTLKSRFSRWLDRRRDSLRRIDPIVARVVLVSVLTFIVATVYFSIALKKDAITALYFVATTITTVGYGDITPLDAGPWAKVFAVGTMFFGVTLSGVFVALLTSALTRAQWVATQGLRRIKRKGHIIVCGSGNVGTRVIEYLLTQNRPVVVIDPSPDQSTIEFSRNRYFDLLTGDATNDTTLSLCNLRHAVALIALTDSDTSNLEVGLGARARNPDLQVVMRVQDDAFARSIARQFGFTTTFSTSALAAPAFAGLSRFPGTRGRISYGDDDYTVGERLQGAVPAPPPADHCIPLAVWRGSSFVHINSFDEMLPHDRLLFLVPLSQFRTKPAVEVRAAEPIPT